MKKMKQQIAMPYQPYSSYSTANSMASGYPVTRPSTNASSTFGHLPTIPQNPLLQNGLRLRPASGLQLSVKALPNSTGLQPSIPRERPPQIHRLSSSDSKAMEQLRAPSPATRTRRNSSGEHLLRAKMKQTHLHKFQKDPETLPLPPRRPPSSSVHPRQPSGDVLPPIGLRDGPAKESGLQLAEDDNEETDSETDSDLEDEVWGKLHGDIFWWPV